MRKEETKVNEAESKGLMNSLRVMRVMSQDAKRRTKGRGKDEKAGNKRVHNRRGLTYRL